MYIFVVNHLNNWPFDIPGTTAVAASKYLTDPIYSVDPGLRVINLCRGGRYQGHGYYVSLLAEARGHHPQPSVRALEDVRLPAIVERIDADLSSDLQREFEDVESQVFELSGYFGRDPAGAHDSLAATIFASIGAPLFRAVFEHRAEGWKLASLKLISPLEVPSQHRPLLLEAATQFVSGKKPRRRGGGVADRPSLAILYNPDEPDPPSNRVALDMLRSAAEEVGMRTEIIGRDDLGRLGEFDALFIRDTTNVNHYTYQFARHAAAEGLVVVDDPDSIVKCTNKVYLNELMMQHRIPTPKTLMVHRGNATHIVSTLGLPCILKQPDSAFSLGVSKMKTEDEVMQKVNALLNDSELVIAQEFLPTDYDWRIGVLDGRPLYACKYYMAPGHWQVVKRERNTKVGEGATAAVAVSEVPSNVLKTAVRAASLIGEGLYGVDLKQSGDQCYLIEVNDNPNIDAGNEDGVLKDALYRELAGYFRRRIEERNGARARAANGATT
jgi:glutathione synthase/RimK-type ligase-like ATP-grasp enzyme